MPVEERTELEADSRDWRVLTWCRLDLGRNLPREVILTVEAREALAETEGSSPLLSDTPFPELTISKRGVIESPAELALLCNQVLHDVLGIDWQSGAPSIEIARLTRVLWGGVPLPVLGSPPQDWSTLVDLVKVHGPVVGALGYAMTGNMGVPGLILATASTVFLVRIVDPAAAEVGKGLSGIVRSWFRRRAKPRSK